MKKVELTMGAVLGHTSNIKKGSRDKSTLNKTKLKPLSTLKRYFYAN